jgi:N-ethylmaleimide reductase
MSNLHSPVILGELTLKNRIVMAPLTRMRSRMPGNVPQQMNADYYAQRATAGLIISEATPISPTAHGFYATPGIHTAEQVEGWKLVTNAVHQRGTPMFLQLWHVGRVSHQDLQPDGALPVAPSAIGGGGQVITANGPQPTPIPRALETAEIRGIVEDYGLAAKRAMDAEFDGVEVHAANGYLLEQFLSDRSNLRTDIYGGPLVNRARILMEILETVISVVGKERVGVRISPSNTSYGSEHTDRWATYSYLVQQVAQLDLAYVHIVEPRVAGNVDVERAFDLGSERFRPLLSEKTLLISAGGHDVSSATAAVDSGQADLVAFGRHFIANPDLPERIRTGANLNVYDRSTFYGGSEKGYLDYPSLTTLAPPDPRPAFSKV